MKKEIVDDEFILKIVNRLESLVNNERTIEDSKKDFPDEFGKLKEALNNYISDNDLEISKSELPDGWIYLSKTLAYPHEYFSSIDDYQKPVDNVKKRSSSVN